MELLARYINYGILFDPSRDGSEKSLCALATPFERKLAFVAEGKCLLRRDVFSLCTVGGIRMAFRVLIFFRLYERMDARASIRFRRIF